MQNWFFFFFVRLFMLRSLSCLMICRSCYTQGHFNISKLTVKNHWEHPQFLHRVRCFSALGSDLPFFNSLSIASVSSRVYITLGISQGTLRLREATEKVRNLIRTQGNIPLRGRLLKANVVVFVSFVFASIKRRTYSVQKLRFLMIKRIFFNDFSRSLLK